MWRLLRSGWGRAHGYGVGSRLYRSDTNLVKRQPAEVNSAGALDASIRWRVWLRDAKVDLPVARQQKVYAPLSGLIADGTLHAVNIKAHTPGGSNQ